MQKHLDTKYNKKLIKFLFFLQKKLDKTQQINLKVKKFFNKKKNIVDPVTALDLKIEKLVGKLIKSNFNHKIIGEEIFVKNQKVKSDFTWYIDPIDGTKNMLMGTPTWSNLVGLFYKDRPLMSLANFPELKTFYISYLKKSLKVKDKKKIFLSTNKKKSLKGIKIATNTYRSINKSLIKKIHKKTNCIFRITGIDALNFCLLAEGKIDVVFEKGLKKVDYMPLIPLLNNSGAFITDWKGKQNFSRGDILVSANRTIHNLFLKILKKK